MKIGNIFNEVINEDKGNKYKYGCVMLYLDNEIIEEFHDLIDNDDLYLGTNDDPGYGLEDEPHVTVLYGIHSDVNDSEVEKLIKEFKRPVVILNEITIFENDDKPYDVVKFDVKNEMLNDMNKTLKQLPYTTDYPDYKAHVTIGYVIKGKGKKYVTKLNKENEINIKPNSIVYSKPNGTKKTYKFKQ